MSVTASSTTALIEALAAGLPDGVLVTDPDRLESYRYDRAQFCPAGMPAAVVLARETAHVSHTLAVANELGVPVVPQGARSGLSGAANAVDGCVVLGLEKMDRVLEVDAANRLVVTQPGVFNADLSRAVAEVGLFYPPDPSSWEFCSIGGNLSTNSGGLCCVKYGVTTDYVLGLEVVLADGRVLKLGGRTIKDVADYDLKRLFVGSEGTLGVITEATLRLRPLPPPATTVAATFVDVVDAGRAVTAIMTAIRPAALELMDRAAVRAVEQVKPMGFGDDVGAVLLGQSDGGPGGMGRAEADVIAAACEAAGASYVAVTDDQTEGDLLMGGRRMAIPCVERLGSVLIEDIGVPIPRIPDLIAAVEAIAARRETLIPVIGHAGDGNFHPLVTFDPADPDARARAELAFGEIMDAALELGGTVTGEHGVGTLKGHHLGQQLGADVLDVTKAIKRALDPDGILNPGKWV
jgi:glycolate oxidase